MAEERNNFSFRDIEESLENFDGEHGKDATLWLKEFEEIATMCKWGEIQKYLYARRLLRGASKLAVESDAGEKNWAGLKQTLIQEFSATKSSISLHRILENRKKLSSESYLEYVYAMKQIAAQGNIDEESVVAYVIAGINDDPSNKALLYEAKTIASLKEKFKAYEHMKSQKKINEKSSHAGPSKKSKARVRCLTCGAYSHASNNCPHKPKGVRCFNCNEFGHVSAKCLQPRKPRDSESQSNKMPNQVNNISIADSTLNVSIEDRKFTALVDTGSDITLITRRVYSTLSHSLNCEGPSIALTGFGRKQSRTICSIPLNLSIGEDNYKIQGHVVHDDWLSQDVLIGKDLLKKAILVMENGKPFIKKNLVPEFDSEANDFLQQMDILELIKEEELLSINEISDQKLREEVKDLVNSYTPVKPAKSPVEMHITLEDETPVYHKPRRLAPREREIVKNQVQEWLRVGIIRDSHSEFASPVVLAKKSDESNRLYIDYRKLNKKILKDRYPLPLIEEVLEDLRDGFHYTRPKEWVFSCRHQ